MKTWLPIAVCFMVAFLASDRSFVSGYDLQNLEAEEEMSLRSFPDDEAEEEEDDYSYSYEEEDDEGADRKRRAYGQPSNVRPIPVRPNPPNGGIISPGFPQPIPQPGYPQPPISNPNRPPIGVPQPGYPQPPTGNRPPIGNPNPVYPPIGGGKPGLTRPINRRVCQGVSRSSPHWVPGLDSWCSQNCPTGNCPSHLCVCY